MKEKLLEILNKLPSGDYIRIRDKKHSYLGNWHQSYNIFLFNNPSHLEEHWETLIDEKIIIKGDTLYRIEDITEPKVKPLIYL